MTTFSSVDLALDLLRAGLYSCGSLRSNCWGFPTLSKPVVKKGLHTRAVRHTSMEIILTGKQLTGHTNLHQLIPYHKNQDGTTATYSCPDSHALYNENMGKVDRNDQLRGYYHVQYKCRNTTSMCFGLCFTWQSRTLTY